MVALKALLISTLAATTASAASLDKRTVGGIYLCTDYNWKNCAYKVQPLGVCIGLDAPYFQHVRSMGPDPGTKCYLWGNKDCTNPVPTDLSDESTYTIRYPGSSDMVHLNGHNNMNWDHSLGSFICYAE